MNKELHEYHIKYILGKINTLEERDHTNLFEIIKNRECKFTENDNGIFVRMNQMSMTCIWEIYTYIKDKSSDYRKNENDENDDENDKNDDEKDENNENDEKDENDENDEKKKLSKNAKTEETKLSTPVFLKNNLEIDEWKKDIITKLKSKTKK